MSMRLPPLWAHHPPQTVWQTNMSGLAIPSCIRIAHRTTSCPPSCVLSLPWAADTASVAGDVGSCNHQHPRDEVFGVEEAVVACKPFRPTCPCLPSKRRTLHYNITASDARAVRCPHPRGL